MDKGVELLARWGYAARGVVYLLIAGLALFSGFAGGGGDSGTKGAFESLLGQPFGAVMLGALAVGLVGFALWRLVQGLFNADHRERDWKGYAVRAGQVGSAAIYGGLALTAAGLALGRSGGSSGGGGGGQQGLVATALQLPFGTVLLGAVGVGIFIYGGALVWRGLARRYEKYLRLPAGQKPLLEAVATYGLAARGVVFAIAGGFLVFAALTVDPQKAGTLPQALDWVRGLPFGGVLYVLVAVGLLAYAGYCGIEAVYRHVDAPSGREMARAVPGV